MKTGHEMDFFFFNFGSVNVHVQIDECGACFNTDMFPARDQHVNCCCFVSLEANGLLNMSLAGPVEEAFLKSRNYLPADSSEMVHCNLH